ncbi:putative alginate O-acetylase [Gammaproteobacteria bacterium]
MLFNSWNFLIFLVIVFSGYYFGPYRIRSTTVGQVTWLTVASFLFYGWKDPILVFLLMAACAVNAFVSRRLLRSDLPAPQRWHTLMIALGVNLGVLAFFKYASLLANLVLPASLLSLVGPGLAQVPLPVGISFFTFQGISLLVDSYRASSQGFPGLNPAQSPPEIRWFHQKVWFFKAFFPQLVAGPIVKASEFFYQIGHKRWQNIEWDRAVKFLIAGFFLKMVVADNLHEVTAALAYPAFLALPRINLIALLYAFSAQIYADFCGYSLIAMGLAELFGYHLPINFKHPYLSRNITEFWGRWHISLSSWLREYLYFPLGGNRRGPGRTYINLLIVMFLGGLWHGAAWSYAIWGTVHGFFLALERSLARSATRSAPVGWSLLRVLGTFVTFNLVSVLWLLFKLPEFSHVIAYARCLVDNPGGTQPQALFVVFLFSLPVVAQHLWAACPEWVAAVRDTLGTGWAAAIEVALYAVLLFLIVVNSGPAGEFIYFQF